MGPAILVLSPLCSALVMLALGLYSLRYRGVPGATSFRWGMFLGAAWALSYSLDLDSSSLVTKVFLTRLRVLAIAPIPVMWFALALQYSSRGHLLTRRRWAALLLLPAITSLISLTDASHGLMSRAIHLNTTSPVPLLVIERGPWYWVHVAYCYFLMLGCLAILHAAARRSHPWYRSQPRWLMAGVLVPLVSDMLSQAGLTPVRGYHLTPTTMLISGVAFGWALFRCRIFDIVPIARDLAIDNMGDAVVILDNQGRIVDVNGAAQRLLGVAPSDAIGQPAGSVLRPAECLSGEAPSRQVHLDAKEGGTERSYERSDWPIKDRDGLLLGRLVILHDITEREMADQARVERERRIHLLRAQEVERRRIAREIHDELGQSLTAIKIDVDWVRHRLARSDNRDDLLSRLDAVSEMSLSAIRTMRHIATQLRPSILDDLGLVAAADWQIAEFTQRTGIECEWTPGDLGGVDVPPEQATTLYRILQEALTNVARHAQAERVAVRLYLDGSHLALEVSDNGRGVNAAQLAESPGLGILGMRERAFLAGGELTIDGDPERGTRVWARVPLALPT